MAKKRSGGILAFWAGVWMISSFTTLGAEDCGGLVSRFSIANALPAMISQKDIRLFHEGFFVNGRTYLCGSTCLLNLGQILRVGLGVDAVNPVEEMRRLLSIGDLVLQERSKSMRAVEGLSDSLLRIVAKRHLDSLDISSEFESVTAVAVYHENLQPISKADLFGESEPQLSIITASVVSEKLGHQFGMGHAILAIGDPANPDHLLLIDPMSQPIQITKTTLRAVNPFNFPSTFLLDSDAIAGSSPGDQWFIQGILKFKNLRSKPKN